MRSLRDKGCIRMEAEFAQSLVESLALLTDRLHKFEARLPFYIL